MLFIHAPHVVDQTVDNDNCTCHHFGKRKLLSDLRSMSSFGSDTLNDSFGFLTLILSEMYFLCCVFKNCQN